jgi:cell division protein FtsA
LRITKGLRKGKILDKQALTEELNQVIKDCQTKLGGDYVDEYVLGISHPSMRMTRIQEQKRVMSDKITQEDVQHLSNVIADISQKDAREVLKIIPIYRVIDEKKKEKDPINITAKKLDIVADIFAIPKTFYNTLAEIIDSLGLYVTDMIPNILATAEASLDYDMKDLGTVVIDIGKNQTSYSIYEE